jgi:hypothetical protein
MKAWLAGFSLLVLQGAPVSAQTRLGLCAGDDSVLAEFRETRRDESSTRSVSSPVNRHVLDLRARPKRPVVASHPDEGATDAFRDERQR